MGSAVKELPFLDFGNAPELFAHDVREIQVIGSTVRFTFAMERAHHGDLVAIAVFHVTMPLDRVAGAWGKTAREVGPYTDLPSVSQRFFRRRDGDGDGRSLGC